MPESEWKRLRPFYAVAIQAMKNERDRAGRRGGRKKSRKAEGNKMAINLSDLPPKYQAQAMEKYMKQQARRGAYALRRRCAGSQEGKQVPQHPNHTGAPSGVVLHFDSQRRPAGMTS